MWPKILVIIQSSIQKTGVLGHYSHLMHTTADFENTNGYEVVGKVAENLGLNVKVGVLA